MEFMLPMILMGILLAIYALGFESAELEEQFRARSLNRIARIFNGKVRSGFLRINPHRVTFDIGDCAIALHHSVGGYGGGEVVEETIVCFKLAEPYPFYIYTPFSFHLEEAKLFSFLNPLANRKRPKTGTREFDDSFIIKATNDVVLQPLRNPETQDFIARLNTPTISLTNDGFVVSRRGWSNNIGELLIFIWSSFGIFCEYKKCCDQVIITQR